MFWKKKKISSEKALKKVEKWEEKGKVRKLIRALDDEILRQHAAHALANLGEVGAIKAIRKHEYESGVLEDILRKFAQQVKDPLVEDMGKTDAPVLLDAEKDFGTDIDSGTTDGSKGEEKDLDLKTRSGRMEALIAGLEDPDPSVRQEAALDLGGVGDTRAVPKLIEALSDSDIDVQGNAMEALGKIGDPRSVSGLVQALKEDNWESGVAAEALGKIGDKAVVVPLILKFGADNECDVGLAVIYALKDVIDVLGGPCVLETLREEKDAGIALAAKAFEEVVNSDMDSMQAVNVILKAFMNAERPITTDEISSVDKGKAQPPRKTKPLVVTEAVSSLQSLNGIMAETYVMFRSGYPDFFNDVSIDNYQLPPDMPLSSQEIEFLRSHESNYFAYENKATASDRILQLEPFVLDIDTIFALQRAKYREKLEWLSLYPQSIVLQDFVIRDYFNGHKANYEVDAIGENGKVLADLERAVGNSLGAFDAPYWNLRVGTEYVRSAVYMCVGTDDNFQHILDWCRDAKRTLYSWPNLDILIDLCNQRLTTKALPSWKRDFGFAVGPWREASRFSFKLHFPFYKIVSQLQGELQRDDLNHVRYLESLEVERSRSKETIFEAIDTDDLEVIKATVNAGVTVNALNEDKKPTLLYAVGADKGRGYMADDWEMVKLLVELGADLDAVEDTEYGGTALHKASHSGFLKTAEVLIEAGADVNMKNKGGKSPLDLLLMCDYDWNAQYQNMYDLLVSHGAKAYSEMSQFALDNLGLKKSGVALVIGCGFRPTESQAQKIREGGFIPDHCNTVAVIPTGKTKMTREEAFSYLFIYYQDHNLGDPPGVGGRELNMPDGTNIWVVNSLEGK